MRKVTSGFTGGVPASASVSISDNTQYTLRFHRKRMQVTAATGTATFTYDSSHGIALSCAMDSRP